MINYGHFYRLTKEDLLAILTAAYPHLKGSFYTATKRDIIGELCKRKTFGEEIIKTKTKEE